MTQEILAVDIGGVIITQQKIGDDYALLPKVIEVLRRLNTERFNERVYLVSKASADLENKILWSLYQRDFCKKTKISIDNVHFCRQRSEKAPICQKLNTTHFIDDRKENLQYVHAVNVPNLYLFQGREEEEGKYMEILPFVKQVASWQEIEREFFPQG